MLNSFKNTGKAKETDYYVVYRFSCRTGWKLEGKEGQGQRMKTPAHEITQKIKSVTTWKQEVQITQ